MLHRGESSPREARRTDYLWSSYRMHGLGEHDELVDRLIAYDELSPYPGVRQRIWERKVHQPIEEQTLAAIRRSSATGLPHGDDRWVDRVAKKLNLDLTIRPRGRPRKTEQDK
ncbi:MAG TPA: hypothetical protein VFI31_22965 [Pirellulales bacterium]|nr:hypothetical protein [Pirellulales bacterium]